MMHLAISKKGGVNSVMPSPVFHDNDTKGTPEVRARTDHKIILVDHVFSKTVRFVTRKIVVKRCCYAMAVTAVRKCESRYFIDFHIFLGFHMFCLDPPLDTIPKEQWYCYTCLAGTGGDYGFDEGQEHSLSSFQARDSEFRRVWFESHPLAASSGAIDANDPTSSVVGGVAVSEYDLENEFWRLVNTQEETVEVEYGADVHSTTHGR